MDLNSTQSHYLNTQLYDCILLLNGFINYIILSSLFLFLILFYWSNIWNNQLLSANYYKILIYLVIVNTIVYLYYLALIFYYFFPVVYAIEHILSEKIFFSSNVVFSAYILGLSTFGLKCSFSKLSLSFLMLFLVLQLIVFTTIWHDYGLNRLKFYLYFIAIFNFTYLLTLTDSIVLFYFFYELILILVFVVMFLSSYSRAAVDALLYFLIWAIVGSVLVAYGVLLTLEISQAYTFTELELVNFTPSESYFIYLLLFFGFGVKLSIWPFWYWLPKAHVEVSTGMSIFLSCVLIKLSMYALLKFHFYLYVSYSLNICILVCFLCVIDVMFRFLNLRDLKAVIAYSSVLHTNLLVALVHLDNIKILSNSLLYIWGHSIATAGLFWCVYFIELRYNTRNITKITGLWYSDSRLGKILFLNLISFIDLPITLMFWGELWLWVTLVVNYPLLSIQLYLLGGITFIVFFFKIWWGVMLGVSGASILKPVDNNFYIYYLVMLYIIGFQVLVGIQPSILKFLII